MNEGSVDMSSDFDTKRIGDTPDAIAPDGSEVRLLCSMPRGSMAAFRLAPKAVSKAVTQRTVEEIWYFTAGHGRMWRELASREEIAEVAPGVSITIPTGTQFQFRCDGSEPLAKEIGLRESETAHHAVGGHSRDDRGRQD